MYYVKEIAVRMNDGKIITSALTFFSALPTILATFSLNFGLMACNFSAVIHFNQPAECITK